MQVLTTGSKEAGDHPRVLVEITACPECGTEWEVVVTRTRAGSGTRDLRSA